MTDLQSTVTKSDARNSILSLIGNIYTLQTQLTSGDVSKSDFDFFVTNIQKGLDEVRKLVNPEPSPEELNKIVGAQIIKVLALTQRFQAAVKAANVQKVSSLLQTLLSLLQKLGTTSKNVSITKSVTKIVNHLTKLQGQVNAGDFNTTNILKIVKDVVGELNEISATSTANAKMLQIQALIHSFQVIVKSGTTQNINAVLKQVHN